jgi:hypothetical protein
MPAYTTNPCTLPLNRGLKRAGKVPIPTSPGPQQQHWGSAQAELPQLLKPS